MAQITNGKLGTRWRCIHLPVKLKTKPTLRIKVLLNEHLD